MNRSRRMGGDGLGFFVFVFVFGFLCMGCGDDQDPTGAKALWDRIHAEKYQMWDRAPGYAQRTPTNAPHSDSVEIFVNAAMSQAIQMNAQVWPEGAVIVKDGYDSGGDLDIVAAMEKKDGAWYWAEYPANGNGEADYSGVPGICTDCHASGRDFVRFFNP